jgi:MFS family permease
MRARLTWPHEGLWRHPDFLRLWAAQTISEFGSQITLLALPLAAILVLHATTFEVAVLSTIELVPFLLFGLLAGVWVDRLPHRPVLVATDLGRAIALASVPLAYALNALTLPQLYVVGFATGTLTVFFSLASHAYLPALLERERLIDANAKLEVSRSLAQTGGPAAGGGLVSLFSAPAAILGDALSFLASGLLLLSIKHREQAERSELSAWERALWPELREGLGYVWGDPIWRANVYSAGLANFAYGVVWAILLVFAVRVLDLHAGIIGVILALGEAGGILGALTATRIARKLGIGPTMIAATALCGPAVLLIAVAPRTAAIPLLALGWALWSFGGLVSGVIGVSTRQALVPQRLQGRVVGSIRWIIRGIVPLGSLTGGALATSIGIRPTLGIGAAISFVAFVPLLLSPFRGLRDLPPTEPRSPAEAMATEPEP